MKRKTLTGVAMLAMAALAMTACGGSGDASSSGAAAESTAASEAPAEMQVIKVGMAMPLTGPLSVNAADLIKYATYGIEDANKVLAADGIQLELVSEDTMGTAEAGVAALNKLVNIEQTPIVLTAYSTVVSALAPLAEDLGVALVNIGAQSNALAGASPNLINFYPLGQVLTDGMAKYLTGAGYEAGGIIYVDNEGGISPANSFKDAFEAAGGTIVGMEPVRPEAPDASVPVAKLLDSNPDVVYFQTTQPETPPVVQALRAEQPDLQLATHSGIAEDVNARQATGSGMNGTLYATLVPLPTPELQAVIDRFTAAEGREPSLLSLLPYEYDFGTFIGEIAKQVKAAGQEMTGSNMVAAVRANTTYETPLVGTTTFREDLTITVPVSIKRILDASQPASTDEIVAAS